MNCRQRSSSAVLPSVAGFAAAGTVHCRSQTLKRSFLCVRLECVLRKYLCLSSKELCSHTRPDRHLLPPLLPCNIMKYTGGRRRNSLSISLQLPSSPPPTILAYRLLASSMPSDGKTHHAPVCRYNIPHDFIPPISLGASYVSKT